MLEQRGIDATELQARTGLSREQLADPNGRITIAAFCDVLVKAVELAGDPALGVELGLQLKPSSHGLLGLALMTCKTLGDAIAVGERFGELRISPWRLQLLVEGDTAIMRFIDVVPMGAARSVMFEAIVGAAVCLGEQILGISLADPAIEFWSDSPELPHHARYQGRLPRIRYERPTNEARFPASWLERPLVLGEPIANREAVAVLEKERAMLAFDDDDLHARTQALLADPTRQFPDLEQAATALGISSRTLRRRLSERGTTYQQLRDDARRARAIELLERSAIAVEVIASELAYSDAGSFVRAFQRWTGETPQAYRRRVQLASRAG
ncbi:MAG: AraC family transcriptional regulator [Kofleriaceae bacterium]|nr:AraC family transcriptional regulator [Kofleriaceae bacterium]